MALYQAALTYCYHLGDYCSADYYSTSPLVYREAANNNNPAVSLRSKSVVAVSALTNSSSLVEANEDVFFFPGFR